MDYVTIDEVYKHKFYQIPKIFFINERYKNMSIHAKVAWALLYERCSLSRRNRWYDKGTNRVYFIYTNSELMKIMNIKSKSTLSKVKKELEDLNLLESKRRGLNKPNRLYLGYPEFNESDLYAFEKQEETNTKTLADKGSPFSGRPENGLQDVQKVNTNNTNYNNPELEDIDTVDTSENIKKQLIEKAFYGNYGKIPKNLSNAFEVFCRSTEEAEIYYKSINQAKLDVFKDALDYKDITLLELMQIENNEELLQQVVNTFVRVIRKVERERNIDNPQGYLYRAVYQEIWNYFD